MSCDHCPPSSSGDKNKDPRPNPNPNPKAQDQDKGLVGLLLRLLSTVLPEGSALLSSSCCWLPTALDFVFSGSVTAASLHKLRPFFLTLSIVTLAWSIAREGLTRRNIIRAIVCGGLLAWAQYSTGTGITGQEAQSHSCH